MEKQRIEQPTAAFAGNNPAGRGITRKTAEKGAVYQLTQPLKKSTRKSTSTATRQAADTLTDAKEDETRTSRDQNPGDEASPNRGSMPTTKNRYTTRCPGG